MFDLQNIKRNVSRFAKQRIGNSKSDETRDEPHIGQEKPAATIGSGVEFSGDLKGTEDILIDGLIDGTVTFENHTVIIGSQGRIQANITAATVIIEGEVHGDVFGREKVIVRQTGHVLGDIQSPRVSLEDGAIFKGCIEMQALPYVERTSESTDADDEVIHKLSTMDR